MGRMIRFFCSLVIVVSGLLLSSQADAESANLLVLYARANATYDRIFTEIVDGIKSHEGVVPFTHILTAQTRNEDIQEDIKSKKIDAIIALGQSSFDFASRFKDQILVVHGGMLMAPDGHSGISLAGSPAEFFDHLQSLAPPVKRVFTVYSKDNNGWLIKLAAKEAKKRHMELHALEADDIRQGALKFREILDQTKSSSDAIWLLLDKVLPDNAILPMALEAAWKKNVILFSSNPLHTRRGALFALFPDHRRLGYNLSSLTLKLLHSNSHPTVVPLSDLKIAVNERTASHLGLRLSNVQLESFDVIYPLR
jgi:putative ABC transport system substrate-binding protein